MPPKITIKLEAIVKRMMGKATVAEIAEQTGIPASSIYRMHRQAGIKPYKPPRLTEQVMVRLTTQTRKRYQQAAKDMQVDESEVYRRAIELAEKNIDDLFAE